MDELDFDLSLSKAIKNRDVLRIKKICLGDDGLRNDENRSKAWPILLGIQMSDGSKSDWRAQELKSRYQDIIGLDVNRSMFGLDLTDRYTDEERENQRQKLTEILNGIFISEPNLHYSQGFHSICTTFLLVGGLDLGFKMSLQCANLFIKDSLRENFDQGVVPAVMLFYDLLKKIDAELEKIIEDYFSFEDELSIPMFCFPWIVTWLGQDIPNYDSLCRVYDFFLATHPLAPIYFSVAIVLSQKTQIMETQDMPELHHYCGNIVPTLNMNELCKDAYTLIKVYPPCDLIKSSNRQFPAE